MALFASPRISGSTRRSFGLDLSADKQLGVAAWPVGYVGLNLGLLGDDSHLGALSAEDRQRVVGVFIRATILAGPGARKNSMNAHTLPGYVLGLVKEKGQPLQLINAFEKPVS
ncbi:MAG: type I-E CRISPR-associated protein Cas7/Cse4/CasC, partial [Acidobacteriia bacterium]|nr:type I-E CRISPR-associated protein Cas7/Cse4/CasC [Terriglobia bacterium]